MRLELAGSGVRVGGDVGDGDVAPLAEARGQVASEPRASPSPVPSERSVAGQAVVGVGGVRWPRATAPSCHRSGVGPGRGAGGTPRHQRSAARRRTVRVPGGGRVRHRARWRRRRPRPRGIETLREHFPGSGTADTRLAHVDRVTSVGAPRWSDDRDTVLLTVAPRRRRVTRLHHRVRGGPARDGDRWCRPCSGPSSVGPTMHRAGVRRHRGDRRRRRHGEGSGRCEK